MTSFTYIPLDLSAWRAWWRLDVHRCLPSSYGLPMSSPIVGIILKCDQGLVAAATLLFLGVNPYRGRFRWKERTRSPADRVRLRYGHSSHAESSRATPGTGMPRGGTIVLPSPTLPLPMPSIAPANLRKQLGLLT
jgi:hypothetical protein